MTLQHQKTSMDRRSSIELSKHSPAPTYTSTMHSNEWAGSPKNSPYISNNPYYQPPKSATAMPTRSMKATDDLEAPPAKPDYQDPNHPHFAEHSSPPVHDSPRMHRSVRRWPQKRVLIPWILAVLFFLTTLWLTSIAMGARVLTILRPLSSAPTVQEIHIHMDDDRISIKTPTPSPSQTQVSSSAVASLSSAASAKPTTTGSPNRAPNGVPPFEWISDSPSPIAARSVEDRGANPIGFVTITTGVE